MNFCLALHSSPLVIITYKHKWNTCSMKMDSRSRGWMGWLTTHHECHGFLIFHQTYVQNHWQEDTFLGYASRPPSKSMLSVVQALCKLDQHCQTPPLNSTCTYDNTHDMSMKEPTWNLSQPLTVPWYISGSVPVLTFLYSSYIWCENFNWRNSDNFFKYDWIWENLPLMYNDKCLEICNSIIQSVISKELTKVVSLQFSMTIYIYIYL